MLSDSAHKQITLSALSEAYENPHPLYDALRAHDPIYYDTDHKCWLVTSYAAVKEILTDERFSSELSLDSAHHRTSERSFIHTALNKMIIFMDDDVHRQFQKVVLRKLGQMGKQIPIQIRAIAESLLDFDTLESHEDFDLVEDFAYPFSLLVIAEVMGVPTDDYDHLLELAEWSDSQGHVSSGYLRVDWQDINRLGDYFRDLIATKRRSPGDDLISALIEADLFEDEDELIVNCMMIFSAGRMTTKKLLANGIPLLLAQWREWGKALGQKPKLGQQLTEELLRFVTPTRYLTRLATEDIDLSGQYPGNHLIRRGDKVVLFLDAANRDAAYFSHPEQLNPERDSNRHLAFGFGPHYCPGARLARLETEIALDLLFKLFLDLEPDPEFGPIWSPNPNLGGYDEYLTCPVFHDL